MTKKECVDKLNEWRLMGDTETVHIKCDEIILEFLKEHHPEIADKYAEVEESHGGFWYA